MESTYNNIDTGLINDGSETHQKCVVVESLPQYSQSVEPGLFLHHVSSLRNTQISPQVQQTNIDTNRSGQLPQPDTNTTLPVHIHESKFQLTANTFLPSAYLGEDEKTSNIYVTSSDSNEPKDLDTHADKDTSKEIIISKQYQDFSGTACPSDKLSDTCSNDMEDIHRSFWPHKNKLNNLKYTCNMKQNDDGNKTHLCKDTQVKHDSYNATECMPIKVSNGNYLENNHLVGGNICEVTKVIDIEDTLKNNGTICNNVNVNDDAIGIDSFEVTEEVTVVTNNDHICIEKECRSYTCGSCEVRFVALCKLHDHFEKQHSTGSYIYFQNTKIGFPRLDNVSKLTQTDLTDLIEVDQDGFKNDEVSDVDNNDNFASELGDISNENIEKMDGTIETGNDAAENFENFDVIMRKDRKKKKVKHKSRKKGTDLKVLSETEENLSLKINVNQKDMLKTESRKQNRLKSDQRSSNGAYKLEQLNKTAVKMETDVEGENYESQTELALCDNEKEKNDITEDTDIRTFENFTTVKNRKCRGAKSKEKVLPSQLKLKQNQISRVKEASKTLQEIDEDKNSGSYKCDICATKYDSKVKLLYHLRKVHKKANTDTEKQCRWCGLTFPGSKSYMAHMRQCEKNEYLMCLICSTRFDSRNKVTNHLLNHRNESELKCRICDRMFTCAVTLQSHLRRHNLRKDLQCEHCGKSFYYHNLLKKHKLYCNREPNIECPHCAVKFKTQDSLKHHMSVHSNVRPFVCHVCGYAAKKSMYLKRHLRCHSGERPYICSDCGMSFAAANGLNRHRKTHTNEKPCICQYCGKSFTNNWNLKTHLRQHTGDTPYQCRQCDKAFKQNVLLKLHIKSHHSVGSVIG